jgi:rRNA maturation protein Rpf1
VEGLRSCQSAEFGAFYNYLSQITVVTMHTAYSKTLHFAHTVYLCVPWDYFNKRDYFPKEQSVDLCL